MHKFRNCNNNKKQNKKNTLFPTDRPYSWHVKCKSFFFSVRVNGHTKVIRGHWKKICKSDLGTFVMRVTILKQVDGGPGIKDVLHSILWWFLLSGLYPRHTNNTRRPPCTCFNICDHPWSIPLNKKCMPLLIEECYHICRSFPMLQLIKISPIPCQENVHSAN